MAMDNSMSLFFTPQGKINWKMVGLVLATLLFLTGLVTLTTELLGKPR